MSAKKGAKKDCCEGEECMGDPRGLHSLDCPVYLASMANLEARTRPRRVELQPDTLSTSARLALTEQRLAETERERDSLARRCAVRFEESEKLRAELVSARQEIEQLRAAHIHCPDLPLPDNQNGAISMTPEELLRAAETKLRDAENNLATSVASLNEHKARHGGVPNAEIVVLAHAQAAVAQTYATLALARAGITLAEGEPRPATEPIKTDGDA